MFRVAPRVPQDPTFVRDQLVIRSDFPLPRQHRLLDEVTALRGDLCAKLDVVPSDEPIQVYLFSTADGYRSFLQKKHPDFPDRRALFVESDTQLSVYAFWGDFVAEDLRHEITHGYLHSVVPNLPLWLDEGFAEFYEVPRGRHGFHSSHVQTLVQAWNAQRWKPNLERLERLTSVAEMSLQDYAESWLWVHFLVSTSQPRLQLVRSYLGELRQQGTTTPLSLALRQLEPQSEQAVIEHLLLISRG